MSSVLVELSQQLKDRLTLLDIGASGGVYEPFRKVLSFSHLVEVDMDSRDFHTNENTPQTTRVYKAIVDDDIIENVKVFLTKSPHCSSTLLPDKSKLGNFPYTDLFEIQKEIEVPATSLNRLAQQHKLTFNWIKLDTQGTELRIIQHMNKDLFENVICCDVEISLYAHYHGSDTFSEFHKFMTENGFLISDIVGIQSRIRLRKRDVDSLEKMGISASSFKKWPTSPEIRYIKNVSFDQSIEDLNQFLKIWIVSFATGNYPYCYYLSQKLKESNLGGVRMSETLERISMEALKPEVPSSLGLLKQKVKRKLISLLDKI